MTNCSSDSRKLQDRITRQTRQNLFEQALGIS